MMKKMVEPHTHEEESIIPVDLFNNKQQKHEEEVYMYEDKKRKNFQILKRCQRKL